jgi:hypothetical protein
MKSGSTCCPTRRVWIITGLLFIILASAAIWWWIQPRTPQELFRARCASCHELRAGRLCEFDQALRPAIVEVMRREHGADQVISAEEALIIQQYLKEEFICP